jgi:hypothetical protein
MSTYAIQIADAAFAILSAQPNEFKTYRRSPMKQVAPEDLPILAVFILRESRVPDGDANAGEPRFQHRLHLGFSGAIAADDQGQQFIHLEQIMADIDDKLLTNVSFVSLVEGFESMDRKSQYAIMGETTLAEIQIEMVVSFRTFWPPAVTDDFKTLHLETRYPSPDTDPAEVEQIVRQWDIEQNRENPNGNDGTNDQGMAGQERRDAGASGDEAESLGRGQRLAGRPVHVSAHQGGEHVDRGSPPRKKV